MQEPGNDLTKSRYAAVSTGALLNVYHAGYARLSESVKELSQRQLNACPVKNRWSIGGIVMHVALAEIQGAAGIRQMMVSRERMYPVSVRENLVSHPEVTRRFSLHDIKEHLELFRLLRATTGKVFKYATAADWKILIHHPQTNEEISLRWFLEFYADHAERHLQLILEKRKLLGRPLAMEMILPVRLY